MSQPIKLAVSVVVYRPDLALLHRSLASLQEAIVFAQGQLPLTVKVIVVDNSCDASQPPLIRQTVEAALTRVTSELIVSPTNGGYGAGNNLAIKASDSDYHLVANPDIFPDQDALLVACRYMAAHTDVAMISPAVRGEDQQPHYLCKRNPTLFLMFLRSAAPQFMRRAFRHLLDAYEMREQDYRQEIPHVDFPTGCFMFFRTSLLRRIDGFDERFFMYYEDADIGRRLGALGRVSYVPSVRIVHRWARETHSNRRLRWQTVKSGLTYWRKWGGLYR